MDPGTLHLRQNQNVSNAERNAVRTIAKNTIQRGIPLRKT
jgi:hypothetical protein